MLREASLKSQAASRDPVRWRGRDVSRLEALTDGMFGFAITLLVVSVEVPPTFDEMMKRMSGFLSFGLCFAMMMWVWTAHNHFFRRFGLTDGLTVALNSALLFVVLFFVYPLKFVATSFVAFLRMLAKTPNPTNGGPAIEAKDLPALFALYGSGFVAVFLLMTLMYVHAYARREHLELSELEKAVVRNEIWRLVLIALIGVTSIVGASLLHNIFIAGFAYSLIGFVEWWHGWRQRRIIRRYAA